MSNASISPLLRVTACALAICASVLMGGCAAGQLASKELDVQAKRFVVPPGKALVYVYRVFSPLDAQVLTKVTLGRSLGVIGPANFLVKVLDPGTHVVLLESGEMIPAKVTFEAKVGEKYFILTSSEFASLNTNRVTQRFVPPEIAEKDLVDFQLAEWID